jgi:hypothetical protein
MLSDKPIAGTPSKPTAGTKPGPGTPELNIFGATEIDDTEPADIELPAELPVELASLASQLQFDAARLANLYPPSARAASSTAPLRPALITPQRLGAAVAVLLIGVIGAWQFLPQRPAAFAPQTVVITHHDRAEPVDLPAIRADMSSAPVEPAAYPITELSGPELEALVDLMQREPAAVQRVSF